MTIGKSVAQNLNTTQPFSLNQGSASLASLTVTEMRKPNFCTANAVRRESPDISLRDSSNTSPAFESNSRARQYEAWLASAAQSGNHCLCSFFTSRGERFATAHFWRNTEACASWSAAPKLPFVTGSKWPN